MVALGIRRRDQPDVTHLVQPVEIVGDHSGFSSQVLPPIAWMGGTRSGVALVYSGLQITSRAPGGTYLRWVEVASTTTTHMFFEIKPTSDTLANQVPSLEVSDMGSAPVTSRLLMGTYAATPSSNDVNPRLYVPSSGEAIPDLGFIPPGYTFQLWMSAADTNLYAAVMFEDCPAQNAAR
jgi:hypothetical protein